MKPILPALLAAALASTACDGAAESTNSAQSPAPAPTQEGPVAARPPPARQPMEPPDQTLTSRGYAQPSESSEEGPINPEETGGAANSIQRDGTH
jgi:hypothetical protein